MNDLLRRRSFFAWAAFVLSVLVLFYSANAVTAAENFILYTDSQAKTMPVTLIEGIRYLPLLDLLNAVGKLSVTEQSIAVLRVQVNRHTFLCRPNSTLVMVDGSLASLTDPILMRGAAWMVPATFIGRILPRFTEERVTYQDGSLRAFVTKQAPARVFFDAQKGVLSSRIAIEVTRAVPFDIKRGVREIIVSLGTQPLDPASERLNYSDELVKSIAFDDANAQPKIRIALTGASFDVKTSSLQDGHVLIVSITPTAFAPLTQPPVTPPATSPSASTPAPGPASLASVKGALRIVTIDVGHGGIDTGARSADNKAIEKDLTLQIALKLRAILQQRLGVRVFLTRDRDMDLSLDQRAIIANTDRSDVFISLHVGYSLVESWTGTRVYVYAPIKEPSTEEPSPASGLSASEGENPPAPHVFFRSWKNANAANFQMDESLGELVQADLSALWNQETSAPRLAPLRPLENVTMPAVMVEAGNLNSTTDVQRLLDPQFQTSIAVALTNAIQQFQPVYEASRKNETTP